jgi:acyl-CoA synthetase (AMP-forming)/AMP-acid ligase II
VLSGERMLGKLEALTEALRFPTGAATLMPLQLTFSFGQWVTFLTLMHGGTVHLMEKFDPVAAEDHLLSQGIDYLAAVPTMLRLLLSLPVSATAPVPAPRILTGGEAVLPDLRRALLARWPAAEIFSIYGLTESGTSDLILHDVAADAVTDSLGEPSPAVETRIDPQTGELQLRTPFGMLGYLDMPTETAATFHEGWLRTGDMVLRGGDGRLVLAGRLKEIINRAGNKISPLEIESLFLSHPAVGAAIATGVADDRLGEAVHLLVIPRDGTIIDPEALRAWAENRIERYKLPDCIHLGDKLPVGRTGKADRATLRRLLEAGSTP